MQGHNYHRFGPFIILRELGRGGMGEVFLARTSWPESPLAAVKRLRPDVARIESFAERFRHEAELAVRLSHPNLVGTLGVGTVGDQLYVAAELVSGKDAGHIADRLRQRSQGGPAAVGIRLVIDGLNGLAYVHDAKEADGSPLELVHRDITPGNVLVGYDGRARLADFGLAKSLLSEGSGLTKQGEILGTPHYLPPELVRGESATSASDVYGLGAVLYRFLTGIAPFQGTTSEILAQVLTERPRPLSDLRPDLPDWMVQLVAKMLERDLSKRPRHAKRLAEEVLAHAKNHELFVPRSAIGQWLTKLFTSEYAQEMEEFETYLQIDPSTMEPPKEGTKVLARAATRSRLHAGDDFGDEDDDDDSDGGTQVELTPSAILGISPPVEGYSGEEMPTRAVDSPAVSSQWEPYQSRDTDLDAMAAAQLSSQPPTEDGYSPPSPELPGFADEHFAPPTLRFTPAPPLASDPLLVTPVPEAGSLPPASSSPVPTHREGTGSHSVEVGRSVLFLAGLLSLAVAVGIGLGKLVAQLRTTQHEATPVRFSPSHPKVRLNALNRHLELLQEAGLRVPSEAWRQVAGAASALLEGDEKRAVQHLEEAESLVQKIRPPAPELR